MPFQRLSGRLNYYITRCGQEVRRVGVKDELEKRCGRESKQKAEPSDLRLSSPGERERHNADGHNSGCQYIAVLVQSLTPSHTQTLQESERYIFLKKS